MTLLARKGRTHGDLRDIPDRAGYRHGAGAGQPIG